MQRHHTDEADVLGLGDCRLVSQVCVALLFRKAIHFPESGTRDPAVEASLLSPSGLMDGVGSKLKSILSLLKTGSDYCS